ncbi:MAG: hypothetical protein F6K35_12565 [Okeania sp. SIO2H7]|nr:hypothetical protein [Okeania sp. SIO2H7]
MNTFATETLINFDNNIRQIEDQIQQLQELLSQQQSERQNIQSIEQMGMSAISQIEKTLAACAQTGLTELADKFKQQIAATIGATAEEKLLTPVADAEEAIEVESPVVEPPTATTAPTDDEILEVIKTLDYEHGTDNYLPIYLYRGALPTLTRKEQDNALYHLAASDRIELSTLQEVRAYTPEQVDAGIPQDIGGRLFFIIVEEEKPAVTKQKVAASVGAAAATDIALMDFGELKDYCLNTVGLTKDDIRKYGKLTRRDTWVKALKDMS